MLQASSGDVSLDAFDGGLRCQVSSHEVVVVCASSPATHYTQTGNPPTVQDGQERPLVRHKICRTQGMTLSWSFPSFFAMRTVN